MWPFGPILLDLWPMRSWGIIHEASVQPRGMAWAMRNVAHAAFLAPDNTPESTYFQQKVNYNLAVKEGQYNITNGSYYNPTKGSPWAVGRSVFGGNYTNPLHYPFYMDPTITYVNAAHEDSTIVWYAERPFMVHIWTVMIGHMHELGFNSGPLVVYSGQHLINWILDPSSNPYTIASYDYNEYRTPDHKYFDNWAAATSGFHAQVHNQQRHQEFSVGCGKPD